MRAKKTQNKLPIGKKTKTNKAHHYYHTMDNHTINEKKKKRKKKKKQPERWTALRLQTVQAYTSTILSEHIDY